jgi:hypothetical protein
VDRLLLGISVIPFLAAFTYMLYQRVLSFKDQTYGKHLIIQDGSSTQGSLMQNGLIITLVMLFLGVFYYFGYNDILEVALGITFMVLVVCSAQYLRLIQLYRYANKHPNELSGKLEISPRFGAEHTLTEILFLSGLPTLLILLFQPSNFVIGCMWGIVVLWWVLRKKSAYLRREL